MITAEGLTKTFQDPGGETLVLENLNFTLSPNQQTVVLGKPGSGKSTLVKLIAGLLLPTSGQVIRNCALSFPVGHVGGFRRDLTVEQNVAYAAALYGSKKRDVIELMGGLLDVKQMAKTRWVELAPQLRREVAFALSYAIPFDFYLIDANFLAGGTAFQTACIPLLKYRFQSAGFLYTARTPRAVGDADLTGAVLYQRKLYFFPTLAEATYVYGQMPKTLDVDEQRQDYGDGDEV